MSDLTAETLEHHHLTVNGVRLHYVAAGPADGPLLILLHGFPEFWYGWRHQIPFFAERGYRVIAPDQRGYNGSGRPTSVSDYTYEKLGGDIEELIRAQGRERALIVGHDWGGAVAWWLAANRPELCGKVVILNVPRPDVLARALRRNRKQLARSWYIFFFQLPGLPESWMSRADYAIARRSLTGSSRKGTFSRAELERYVSAWKQSGGVGGMINWYRAALRSAVQRETFRPIHSPLLLLWGEKDRFLGRELAEPSLEGCTRASAVFVKEASHWIQHEEPQRVNEELLRFFSNGRSDGA